MVKQMQIWLSIAALGVATAAGAESLAQKKAR